MFLSQSINNLTWNEVNCSQRNGLIIGYTVIISNSSITYNLTSTERYIILNDLVFGTEYNISVAAVNSVGRGPFSDPVVVEIGVSISSVQSTSSTLATRAISSSYTGYCSLSLSKKIEIFTNIQPFFFFALYVCICTLNVCSLY